MGKKKKQNKKQRRVLLLLFLMIGTGIIFGTATYAWFTSNRTVSVDPIDVNVTTSSGLQISADATTWKSVLSVDDIKGANVAYPAAVNQIPTQLQPISTVGDVASDRMNMFLGTVTADEDSGNFVLAATPSVEQHRDNGGDFVAFDIFLRTETDQTKIALTDDSGVTGTNGIDGIKNATRVAFINIGNKAASETPSSLQGITGGKTKYIWEPNSDVHTAYGVANAAEIYGVDSLHEGEGNTVVPYEGIKAKFGSDLGITLQQAKASGTNTGGTNENYFAAVDPDIKTNGTMAQTELMTLSRGVTKIRIYMWVEGQDVDCENNASGGAIQFNLGLTIVE